MTNKKLKELREQRRKINEEIQELEKPTINRFKTKAENFERIVELHNKYDKIVKLWLCGNYYGKYYKVESYFKTIELVSHWENSFGDWNSNVEENVSKWTYNKFFQWVFRHIKWDRITKKKFVSVKDLEQRLKIFDKD